MEQAKQDEPKKLCGQCVYWFDANADTKCPRFSKMHAQAQSFIAQLKDEGKDGPLHRQLPKIIHGVGQGDEGCNQFKFKDKEGCQCGWPPHCNDKDNEPARPA